MSFNQPPIQLTRQNSLTAALALRGLDFLVVTKPANILYLSNFRGTAGVAVFGARENVLWVDPRYTLQAKDAAVGARVVEERSSLLKAVNNWLGRRRGRKRAKVGYEDAYVTCAAFRELEQGLRGRALLVPASGIVEELRARKDETELRSMRAAAKLTSEVLDEILPEVRPGARECDLAAEIEYHMRLKGADGPAFETIVASGARSALPHARASCKQLAPGELVIMDLGAILGGYAADMTRTVYLGKPSRRVQRLYNAVREAEEAAISAACPGARYDEVDAAARKSLEGCHLAEYFTHSTGHGVGLEIHEAPRIARKQKGRLDTGYVITTEPGVYLEGFGGIRIEDTVLVTPDGPEILTSSPKDQWFIE
jgi:Xaa-Pro aminopeptidase